MLGKVLVIAGSDSGAGAGIQADIKTISMLGGYATTAITAITAQNTQGVDGILPVPAEFVRAQIESILQDVGANCIKTGMLYSLEIVDVVVQIIKSYNMSAVIDPVMISTSGSNLSGGDDFVKHLCTKLIPLAFLVTPNIPEAEKILDIKINNLDDMKNAAAKIKEFGARNVLVKGGHGSGEMVYDVLLQENNEYEIFSSKRINTKNTHGTGCSLASAIACSIAQGKGVRQSVEVAREFVYNALKNEIKIGHGHGPINHLWKLNG